MVRDFVGADRGVRRLAVTPLTSVLRPVGSGHDVDRLPTVPADGTLYDALAAMLTADALHVVVRDRDHVVGTVSRSAVFGSSAADPAEQRA
jgi:osmoprotectant transport system ATP-binding protein